MVLWIAVLAGAIFAWGAVQVGFYASWIMFFNLALAAYVGLFLAPVIVTSIPAATAATYGYGYGLVLLSVAIATLLISYGICYAVLSGELRYELPKMFDNVGAGLLGFLAGFLVLSFVGFAVSLTPVAQMDAVKTLGLEAKSQEANTSYVYWCCDRFHKILASSRSQLRNSKAAGNMLLARAEASSGAGKPHAPPEITAPPPAEKESPEAAEAQPAPQPQPAAAKQEPKKAEEPVPIEGPLTGTWQAGNIFTFDIKDDGVTLIIRLTSPTAALQSLEGKLTRAARIRSCRC